MESELEDFMPYEMVDMNSDQTRILFVGSSNVCRSPVAQAVLNKKISQVAAENKFFVASAGTHAVVGSKADSRSQHAAAFRGYGLLNHRAQQIRVEHFTFFDFIFAMDWRNLRYLQSMAPEFHRHKVELLMRYAQTFEDAEIPDPYYLNQAAFNQVVDYVEDAVSGLFEVMNRKSCVVSAA